MRPTELQRLLVLLGLSSCAQEPSLRTAPSNTQKAIQQLQGSTAYTVATSSDQGSTVIQSNTDLRCSPDQNTPSAVGSCLPDQAGLCPSGFIKIQSASPPDPEGCRQSLQPPIIQPPIIRHPMCL